MVGGFKAVGKTNVDVRYGLAINAKPGPIFLREIYLSS